MVRIITARDIARLLPMRECIDAVERAFRLLGEGRAQPASALAVHADAGAFHTKAAILPLGRHYFAAKTNGNFPGNPARNGLPTIQGVLVLFDADDGRVLALMDSIELTARRTAAATAVAARWLARPDASSASIVGCGVQARAHLSALIEVLPLRRVLAVDVDPARARNFAEEMSAKVDVEVAPSSSIQAAARSSDVCITCTTSQRFILHADDVQPGAFVAGVGVDNEHKRELAPDLLAAANVVVDSLAQCAAFGDLHHAITAGAMRPDGIHGELSDVIARRVAGRSTADEVFVFDSTGVALEDVAAAAVVYERAAQLVEQEGGGVREIELA